MLKVSYFNDYLKTYFWSGIAVFLNLASFFIVVPKLSNNIVVYGIYSVCISISLFLNYADFGFAKAGFKFAGEYFAKGETEEEVKYYGFSGLLLLVFVSLFAIVFLLFSFYPGVLIKDLSNQENISIASKILMIHLNHLYNRNALRFHLSNKINSYYNFH